MNHEYITSDLSKLTIRNSIVNAYERCDLSIVRSGDIWYMESCPNRIFNTVKKEMKRLFPQLTYLYDIPTGSHK